VFLDCNVLGLIVAVDQGVYFRGCDCDFYGTVDYRVGIGGYSQNGRIRSFFSVEKAKFVYHHIYDAHRLTFLISLTAFLTLVIAKSPLSPYASNARYLKESIGQRRYKKNWVTLIPDILGVVAFSACSPPRPPSQG